MKGGQMINMLFLLGLALGCGLLLYWGFRHLPDRQ
jgi:hypothetical protein